MILVRQLFLYPSSLDGHQRKSECFGGISIAEDGSALKARQAVGSWNVGSNDSANMLIDSGATGHYFDDGIIHKLRDKLDNYQVLDMLRKITIAAEGQLDGVAQGLLRGNVIVGNGVRGSVQRSCLIVPGLGRNLYSVNQAQLNGVVS